MTTASKKIAFIGCSHFAGLEQETQGKNNWTFQLSQKFPQHEYRNYSRGGQGIQGYQLALLDAKIWGADIVFMNRTYMGRWQIELDVEGHEFKYYKTNSIGNNWTEWLPTFTFVWGSVSSGPSYHPGPADNRHNKIHAKIENYFKSNEEFWRVQHNNNQFRLTWELQWYANVHNLYNFENLFLVDWSKHTHELVDKETGKSTPTRSSTTWDIDVEGFFTNDNPSLKIEHRGLTVSSTDHHLNLHGNTRLLNEYILANPKVKKALDT